MSGASLISIALRAPDDEGKSDIQKARDAITAKVTVAAKEEKEEEKEDDNEDDENNEEIDEDDEEKEEEELEKELTAEEKEAKEKQEREAAKAARKEQRIQKRIDTAVAAQKIAEAETLKWKAIAEANPDKKLTEEEVEARSEAKAAEKIATKEVERMQAEFNKACDKLQGDGDKLDKQFTTKVVAMAEELGPIPSRVIGILSDLDNGAEVLKYMVDDIDEAEKIYDLKEKPERLAIALVRISDKLAEAAKPKPKKISKVPDAVKPVNGSRSSSTQITEADTKNPEEYRRKRILQMEERRKNTRF